VDVPDLVHGVDPMAVQQPDEQADGHPAHFGQGWRTVVSIGLAAWARSMSSKPACTAPIVVIIGSWS
jgi:hypothetical protein